VKFAARSDCTMCALSSRGARAYFDHDRRMSCRIQKTDNKKREYLPMKTLLHRHFANAALVIELTTLTAVIAFMITGTLGMTAPAAV
jgi:hypothetical protein